VRVEVVDLDSAGSRQIAVARRATDMLADHADDIQAAIRQACDIAQNALPHVVSTDPWRATKLEATFGVTVATEATVLVARGSAEASFEIVVTIERPYDTKPS
jgi:hypothetical protein